MLDKAREFVKSRQGNIEPVVLEKLELLLEKNPNLSRVYLVGSYAKGYWVDEDTPEWFRQFRVSLGKPDKLSDVDFYTEPQVERTKDYDIIPHLRGYNILIYDNKDTKI